MPSIFDASSLTNLILTRGGKALDLLRGHCVLDLTLYEVGNALWRMQRMRTRLSSADARALMAVATHVTSRMDLVSLPDLDPQQVLDLGTREGITFYDAAYIVCAAKRKLDLVTDDDSLAKVASKQVKVGGSRDL